MEVVIQSPSDATPIEGAEELFQPGEAAEEGQMPEQTGFLPCAQGKHYTLMLRDSTPFSQKLSEQVLKNFDSKTEAHRLSYEDKPQIRVKELQTQKGEKTSTNTKNESQPQHVRADQAGRQPLQMPRQHPPATTRQTLYNMEGNKKATSQKQTISNQREAKKTEQKTQTRSHAEIQKARTKEKIEQQQKLRHDQEEGFVEDEKQQRQDEDSAKEGSNRVSQVKKNGIREEFDAYAAENSTLMSELFNMRVTHFDILILFIEVMKLSLKGREQERKARMEDRRLQLEHIQNIVDNYKQQAKWMLYASLGAGFAGIVSGAAPIVGYTKGGDWILDKLGTFFSSLRGIKKDKFFRGVSEITRQMSDMQRNTGEIQRIHSEGSRSFDQHMADLRRTDWEEETRTMEEIKDHWRNIEQFLHQSLQMYHDTIRQLYS